MKSPFLRLPPPPLAAIILLACTLAYHLVPGWHRHLWEFPTGGWIAFLAGLLTMLSGWYEFRRKDNPLAPTGQPRRLIRSGPYRFTRNPMYLGLLIALLAPVVWLGAPALALAPAIFFGYVSITFIPFEERRMRQTFGTDYADYCAEVRRWV